MSRLPTLPEFSEAIPPMAETLRRVKLALEILGGMQQGESEGAPLVYVQNTQPDPQQDGVRRRGDQWIRTTDDTLWFWNGDQWRRVVTTP